MERGGVRGDPFSPQRSGRLKGEERPRRFQPILFKTTEEGEKSAPSARGPVGVAPFLTLFLQMDSHNVELELVYSIFCSSV